MTAQAPPKASGDSEQPLPAVPPAELLARLRAEVAATAGKPKQARLLHECGVLLELAGEEPSSARDFLAAFNVDPQFREPLESLVRILSRRKSIKNLGKLLDALSRAAETPEERARAYWEHASYLLEHEQNLGEARAKLEEALSANPEDGTAWLELEILGAKEGDLQARMRALEARAELASDPTWKALLYIDLAELMAQAGDAARAYELLDAASALEGGARFRTRLVLEAIAAREQDLDAMARALEGQADLVVEALEDKERGDEIGVPRTMRSAEFAAEAWLRAAELRRRQGDASAAAALLLQAAQRAPGSSVIARARLVALEATGDAEGAAVIAREELDRGVGGPSAASLWLRLAEAAALANDRAGALSALKHALTADPACIPARALEVDLLGDGQEPAVLAESIESCIESFTTDAAKGRAYLLAAYVWACRANNVAAAKAALSQSSMCGVSPGTVSRLARSLASIVGDDAWYEESTKRLLAAGSELDEAPSLWFELGRSRLMRGDVAAANDAFAKLAACGADGGEPGPTAWLGRMLAAFASGLAPAAEASEGGGSAPAGRAPGPIEELAQAESDPDAARGLMLVAALRYVRSGDMAAACDRLRALHADAPQDEVVAIYLAELLRRSGDAAGAARTLAQTGAATEDEELGASLHLEAAILFWNAGDRPQALEEMEAARAAALPSASALLGWALRGADADTLDGRRRAAEAARDGGGDPALAALERFALEVAWQGQGGEPAEAEQALEAAEASGAEDVAVAAALGRLIWAGGLERRDMVERALDRLEDRGHEAMAIARAERVRLARDVDRDRRGAADAAKAWIAAEPTLPVALEWLGASLAADDRDGDVAARRMIASQLGRDTEAASAMEASAAIVAMLDQPAALHRLVSGEHAPGQLMNLELAPPGCDPRRRAAALHGLGDCLGNDAQIDAFALAGWSDLAAGNTAEALEAFRAVVEVRPQDLAAWEGVRTASELLGDHVSTALACAQLGALCRDDARGAEFWEYAGKILLEHTDAHEDAEIAFQRAFERDPRRFFAFDKYFRALRERNDDDRLLGVITKRLEVEDDEQRIAKWFWERARVLRKKGDLDGALAALENVTMLEPDHVGALTLSGEICLSKGQFAEAAPLLAKLSTMSEVPEQQRRVSGVTAVNLYENKLSMPDKAVEVLVRLHKDGLSTLPVRERLAKAAAKTGAWEAATAILEQLMEEREDREGRIEAARLAMAIHRDKLQEPLGALAATGRLLDESPDDGEALDLVLTTSFDPEFRSRMLGRGKKTIVESLYRDPFDAERVALLAKIAGAGQDAILRQATLGVLAALGSDDPGLNEELARLDAKIPSRPQIALDGRAMAEIADPQDTGPVAELMALIAETVSLSLGPSLTSLGVGKRERLDARGGHPLRLAVAEWMGAIGFEGDFDLYVGGPTPHGVAGVAGEQPALVLGSAVTVPFSAASRSAVAREVFALRRGISAVRTRDDAAVASVVIAACNESGIDMPNPGYAVFGEISRSFHKEVSRKVKKAIGEVCQRVAQSGQDPRVWANAARRSIDRMAVLAAGDVSLVLSDVLGIPRERLGEVVPDNERARRLLAFVLSPSYLELRRKLGMVVR